MEWSVSSLGHLSSTGRACCTHWIGARVDPRSGLGVWKRDKCFSSAGNKTLLACYQIRGLVGTPTELNIVRMIKPRRVTLVGVRSTQGIVGRCRVWLKMCIEGSTWKTRSYIWDGIVTMDCEEIRWKYVGWVSLTENRIPARNQLLLMLLHRMCVISSQAENFLAERIFLESGVNKRVKVPQLFQCVHSQNTKLFGDVTPCSLEDGYRRFGIGYPERQSAGSTEALVRYVPNPMAKRHVRPWIWQSLENLTRGLSHFLTCYMWGCKNSTVLR